MAAYAASVVKDTPRVERISRNLGILHGEVNITNYNSTLVEIEDITDYFVRVLTVVAGISDEGYLFEWVDASGAFKAYMANYDQTTAADGPLIEASDDTDVGAAHFIAIGQI